MLVQLVLRSDADQINKDLIEEPFEYGQSDERDNQVILVPSVEHYHQVQGELLFSGNKAKVICLPIPSDYRPPVGKIPYVLVTDTHTPVCDPWGNGLSYYFIKKDTTHE